MNKTPTHFYIGIKGVVYNPIYKKVLFLTRKDDKNNLYWDFPGGRIDNNELIINTLHRELKEEILNIDQYELGKLIHAHRLEHNLKDGLSLMLLFYPVTSNITEVELSKEHISYKWVAKEELENLMQDSKIYMESCYYEAAKIVFSE